MNVTVITAITTTIPVNNPEDTSHDVNISTEDPVGESIARAAAIGGCRAALLKLEGDAPSPWPDRGDDDEMTQFEDWKNLVANEDTTLGFRDWQEKEKA